MKGYILFLLLLALAGCTPSPPSFVTTRGFYYWKSTLGINDTEKQALDSHAVQKLYIKFFDVVWDAVKRQPVPVAKILFTDSSDAWLSRRHTQIVPTVFITNESLLQMDSARISTLGNDINNLLTASVTSHFDTQAIPEIQIDCDWTASTKDKYFALLNDLGRQPFFRQRELSATIRLYQCKYKLKTGVPPVKKGLLMCYNMGNLKNPVTNNSIIEAAELEKYITNLNEYSLPLDIALPLFDWKVLFHQGAYKGLLRELPDATLQDPHIAAPARDNRWTIVQDTTVNGYSFEKGDVVRKEDATFEEVMKTARLLQSKLTTPRFTVVLYHLDSITLHKFSTDELEKMFDCFH